MSLISILPGEGIGNSIKLGDSLYTVVNKFQKYNHKMKIIYSDKKYLETPIIVKLPELGFRLIFENCGHQELILIEVIDFGFVKLSYNGFTFNDISYADEGFMDVDDIDTDKADKGTVDNDAQEDDDSVCGIQNLSLNGRLTGPPTTKLPTLHQIYNKIFGPTYPGRLLSDSTSYILSYPGISFKFTINSGQLLDKLPGLTENAVLSELLNWDNPDDITCRALSVFSGDSWDDFYNDFKNFLLAGRKSSIPEGSKPSSLHPKLIPEIDKLSVNLSTSTISVQRDAEVYTIKLGKTTQQEILNILGPPDDYFNKFDSRLLIHKHLRQSLPSSPSNNNSILKFHNYFKFGLDFLYDLNPEESSNSNQKTGLLKKVIIHNGGVTESLDFMKWNKCNWEIETGGKDGKIVVNSSMYFKEIPSEFFTSSNQDSIRPVLLNRNEAEFIDNELDIINKNEVSARKPRTVSGSSLNEKDNDSRLKIKTWGQSMLYGGNNCIWEVIESSGCITCVTVY
ncbi:hypothetical protein CLIB1423_01S04764 [[Candida] railenensis]|uniref:Uncharacterized protein n=1 Tax=[Candida] railenensis TaxID=45579 RepID=A0A9P0QK91_9ASCO|nr:hypothetical protein CLIB1423_01S04764 [[Candida] railenensis]